MAGRLAGRVAIITGAGRGIGRATAELFAHEGAKVVVATLTAGPGQEVVDTITAASGEAMLVAVDVGFRANIQALVVATIERFGQLDIVVHNAAYVPYGALGALPDEQLDKVFNVGLKAAFWLAADARPHLERSPAGRILVTSSVAGNHESYVNLVHYGALKAGLNGFVRGAGLELARKGITVNGIEPGLTLGHHLQMSASPAVIQQMAAGIPIPRPAQPIEIARGFLFLASDDAAYMTGQTIVIDGGAILGKPGGLGLDKV